MAATPAGSRAAQPGSRAGVVVIVALVVGCLVGAGSYVALTRHSSPTAPLRQSAQKYGGLPSWLPKSSVPVGRVLHASTRQPQLGIEGDAIDVQVGRSP